MKGLGCIAALAVVLAGCSNAIRPTHVTADEFSVQYDTILNTWESVVRRAEEHCAASGRKAELVSRWDNIGTRGATFRCV